MSGTEQDSVGAETKTAGGGPRTASTGLGKALGFLSRLDYVPRRCQWDPENPPKFNWWMCLLFAFVRPLPSPAPSMM